MTSTLMTAEHKLALLENGRKTKQDPDHDPFPVVKLFTPDGASIRLLSEIDPDDEDIAFGLCDLGLGEPELGTVSLSELERLRGPLGLPVARDTSFRAEYTIGTYADQTT
jgi:hypothetical protein